MNCTLIFVRYIKDTAATSALYKGRSSFWIDSFMAKSGAQTFCRILIEETDHVRSGWWWWWWRLSWRYHPRRDEITSHPVHQTNYTSYIFLFICKMNPIPLGFFPISVEEWDWEKKNVYSHFLLILCNVPTDKFIIYCIAQFTRRTILICSSCLRVAHIIRKSRTPVQRMEI